MELVLLLLSCFSAALGADVETLDSNYDPEPQSLQNFSTTLGEFPISNSVSMDEDDALDAENVLDDAKNATRSQFTAEFLTYTAPEEEEDEDAMTVDELLELLQPKRFVFINAPDTIDELELATAQLEAPDPEDTCAKRQDEKAEHEEEETHENDSS